MFSATHGEKQLALIKAAQHFSSTGGKARAASLHPKQRSKIASNAAKARWKNLQANASNLMPASKHMHAGKHA